MIALCYISRANSRFTDEQLTELLKHCHKNNGQLNISGLLLYNGMSTFLQVLEGDPEVIDSLYLKINSDDRHSNVHCISRTAITERNFPNWKMGFRNLSNTPASNLEGFSDFLDAENANDSLLNSPSVVENMLLHFKNKSHEIRL